MTSALVAFLVPADPASVAAEISSHGGVLADMPAGAGPEALARGLAQRAGLRATVAFAGNGASAATDALCSALSEARAPHAYVVGARFDPSMCTPVHARVGASVPGMAEGAREAALPFRFTGPAIDARTLTAALGDADAGLALRALDAAPATRALAA